jgi:hypothetical protein
MRITPVLRVGRRLAGPFRVDAGLGLESVWLEDEGNAQEWEIQWELTGGAMWRSALLAEAGVRRTDYRNAAWEGVARLSLPVHTSPRQSTELDPPPPPVELPFGDPRSMVSSGLLATGVARLERPGSGALLAASNPRGDANPWGSEPRENIDRLGMSGELWGASGDMRAWLRLRSDLHTDPSIRERVASVAQGLSFPLSASLEGGVAWSESDGSSMARLDTRRDFRALRWMPHLGEERTLAALSVHAEARSPRWAAELESDRFEPIAGTTIDALDHASVRVGQAGPTAVGIELERLRIADGEERRLRVTVRREGRIFGAGSLGTDAALFVGARTSEAVDSGPDIDLVAEIEVRSEPELLDYETLIGRGWMRAEVGRLARRPVARASVRGRRGPLSLVATTGWGLPAWVDDALVREAGGRLDARWLGAVGPAQADASLRLADWGAPSAWWREEAIFRADVELPLVEDALRLSVLVGGHTALRSRRTGIEEPAGVAFGLKAGVPVPDLGLPVASHLELRLDDLFDQHLSTRIGAPRLGRRLTGILHVHG